MSCTITSGVARGCRNSSGGVIEFAIGSYPTESSWYTLDADNVITGFTTTAVTTYHYIPNKNSANWSENIQVSLENGTVGFEQTAVMSFNRGDSALRNEVHLLAQNNVIIIAKERSGRYFLLGATEGCELSEGTGGSGTALTDLNGYTITLTAMENAPAYEVSAAAYATLTISA